MRGRESKQQAMVMNGKSPAGFTGVEPFAST